MNYDTITFDITDDIATVTLNRPDVMNALNTQMRAEITDAVLEGGKSARVVVLTGAGKSFCSGQDLGDRANAANLDLERTLRDEYVPMLRAIYDCPVPTISASPADETTTPVRKFRELPVVTPSGTTVCTTTPEP